MLNKVLLSSREYFKIIVDKFNLYLNVVLSYKYISLNDFLNNDVLRSELIFNKHKSLIKSDINILFNKCINSFDTTLMLDAYNYNIIQRILFLNSKDYLTFEDTKKLLTYFLKCGDTLFSPILSTFIFSGYKKKRKNYILGKELKSNTKVDLIEGYISTELLLFIMSLEIVADNDKELIDFIMLKRIPLLIRDEQILNVISYPYHIKMKKGVRVISSETTNMLGDIIARGNIFKNKELAYLSLEILFGILDLNQLINNRNLLICYEQFKNLSIRNKRVLTASLINYKREDCIFNLVSYGLNLNWSIQMESGKETIVGLEVLYSMPLIKMLFASEVFNMCVSNIAGENILHLLGSLPLMDKTIKQLLDNRISKLTIIERNYLFNQVNENGMTPLFKAIYFQDELMIDYILSWGVKVDDIILGLSTDTNSALNFIDNTLLPVARLEKNIDWVKVDDSSYQFWQRLSKEWNSSKLYSSLSKVLNNNGNIIKSAKI
jgi:hypothetical protein